jgi:hypothetical protein
VKFKGTLISEASGSIAGLTFSHNAGGQYVRARAIPVNSNTVYQQAVRNYMSILTAHWSQELTAAQRDQWTAYAEAIPYVDTLGEPRYISGLAMFMACNSLRLLAGVAIVAAGPSILVKPTCTQPAYSVVAPSTGSLTFTNTDDWAGEVGGAMLLFTSRGQGVGINYFQGPYRYAGKVSGAATPPTSPAAIAPVFSVVAGQKVFYSVRIFRADGRIGDAIRLFCTST